jgi:hypothetical protein
MDLLIAPNTVIQAQADAAPATGTPGWATDGNPATNTPATIFPAYAFNAMQAELTAAIQAAGITLDRTKLNQLALALQKMTQGASAITAPDTGAVNALAITLSPAPLALTPGMMVAVDNIVATNTGAATLNVNGLGALPIQFAGGAVVWGGALVAGYGGLFRLNHAGTAWMLIHSTGAAFVASPPTGDDGGQVPNTLWCQQNMFGGANQAWQNLTASRALSTVYTNNTGRTIKVLATAGATSNTTELDLYDNGQKISTVGADIINALMEVALEIPNGHTYEVTSVNANLNTWWEYR